MLKTTRSASSAIAGALMLMMGWTSWAAEAESERPLSREQMDALLAGGVSSLDVFIEIKLRGLDLVPSATVLAEFEQNGASVWLLDRISHYCIPVRATFNLAVQAHSEGRFERAIRDYTAVLSQAPRYLECLRARANGQRQIGKLQDSLADYEAILRYRPQDLMARYRIAQVQFESKNPERALESLNLLLTEQPNFAPGFALRGRILRAAGDHERALADAYEALKHFPLLAEAYSEAALLLAASTNGALRNPQAALDFATAARELLEASDEPSPEARASALQALAASHASLGDFKRAITIQNQALALTGTVPQDQKQLFQQALQDYEAGRPLRIESQEKGAGQADVDPILKLVEDMAEIPAGELSMGSQRALDEQPVHAVRIKPFLIGKREVTVGQWAAVTGRFPERGSRRPDAPVDYVSWKDCERFLGELNRLAAEGKPLFRLPTEAEWEYAARGGKTSDWFFGDEAASLAEYAWFAGSAKGELHPPAGLKPNPWGLYDVYGNVAEWCFDPYGPYAEGAGTSIPAGPDENIRVYRGGSRSSSAVACRSAARGMAAALDRRGGLGLRVACQAEKREEVLSLFGRVAQSKKTVQGFERLIGTLTSDYANATLDKAAKAEILFDAYLVCGYVRYANADYAGALGAFAECQKLVPQGTSPSAIAASCLIAWIRATCPDQAVRNADLAIQLAEQSVEAARTGQLNPWLPFACVAVARTLRGEQDRAAEAAQKAIDQAGPFRARLRQVLPAAGAAGSASTQQLPLPIGTDLDKAFLK